MPFTVPPRISMLYAVILTVFCVTSLAHAEENDDHHRPDLIQVSGTGRITVAPDKADLTLSVEIQAKSAEAARNLAATSMTNLVKAIKKADVADKDIETRTVSLYPIYAPNTANKVSGYQLTNQVIIIVRDLSIISDVIDSAVKSGGNAVRVQGINFSIDNPDSALSQAREKAFADARMKAEHYARLARVKLGRVVHISEDGGMPPRPIPFAEMSAMKMSSEADVSTPVQIGEQEVSVTVNVAFAIE